MCITSPSPCCLSTRVVNGTLTLIFICKLLLNSVVLHITRFHSYCFQLSPSAVTSESCATFRTGPCVTPNLAAAPPKLPIQHQPRSKNINKGRALPPIHHPPLSHGALTLSFPCPSLPLRHTGQQVPTFFCLTPAAAAGPPSSRPKEVTCLCCSAVGAWARLPRPVTPHTYQLRPGLWHPQPAEASWLSLLGSLSKGGCATSYWQTCCTAAPVQLQLSFFFSSCQETCSSRRESFNLSFSPQQLQVSVKYDVLSTTIHTWFASAS